MLAERSDAQHLSTPARSITAVAERLFALQGQDLPAVKWALAVRTAGATEADVEGAFNSGALVRSWPLRGTLHVLPALELEWLRRLTFERNLSRQAKRQRDLGLDGDVLRRARSSAEKGLAEGPLTRDQLFEVWQRSKLATDQQRGVHLLWVLAQEGLLCLADFADGEQRVALSASWVKRSRQLEGDEALAELAVRYFTGHGPATERDLAWWAGLPLGLVHRGVAAAGDHLVVREGLVRPARREDPAPVPEALLLPAFDEYFLGNQDRDPVLDPKYFERVVPGGNGVFQPLVVLDGKIVGTWKRRVQPQKVALSLVPFTRFAARSKPALEEAAARLGRYLARRVELGL